MHADTPSAVGVFGNLHIGGDWDWALPVRAFPVGAVPSSSPVPFSVPPYVLGTKHGRADDDARPRPGDQAQPRSERRWSLSRKGLDPLSPLPPRGHGWHRTNATRRRGQPWRCWSWTRLGADVSGCPPGPLLAGCLASLSRPLEKLGCAFLKRSGSQSGCWWARECGSDRGAPAPGGVRRDPATLQRMSQRRPDPAGRGAVQPGDDRPGPMDRGGARTTHGGRGVPRPDGAAPPARVLSWPTWRAACTVSDPGGCAGPNLGSDRAGAAAGSVTRHATERR